MSKTFGNNTQVTSNKIALALSQYMRSIVSHNSKFDTVFKRLGIIEQWGNGLQLIADDLEKYPEIKLAWKEPGTAFRVSFI